MPRLLPAGVERPEVGGALAEAVARSDRTTSVSRFQEPFRVWTRSLARAAPKRKQMRNKRLMALGLVAVVSVPAGGQTTETTAFTYQGRLADRSVPADGVYDLTFGLFSVASGLSKPIAKTNV